MTQFSPEDTWGTWEEPDALKVEVEECVMQEQGMGVRKQHFSALCNPVDFLLFYSVFSVGFRKGFCETHPHKYFFLSMILFFMFL